MAETRAKEFTDVDGGPSRRSSMRGHGSKGPGSEDSHGQQWKLIHGLLLLLIYIVLVERSDFVMLFRWWRPPP